ncbi:phosphoenolpyruvate--protein phosphotransferase [Hydromonas duriensis]|uniref:phosphoenolpyruvate--protein phosphotransferase n=1 Tax=Hydromonas duriensis TaxID=1527608 RepID=A0A4R6YA63_9BURK|nr:phosphoenolpyruvate--protein phosphotransferase [Hydromonas duriensis]TDR32411.1 phosphocarrier protein HPr /phosphoenolpyruvate--protein phosphotransferase /PTS system IIA component (Glc family) [Hydromonas duriensis]
MKFNNVFAPLAGFVVPLSQVPDPVFSGLVMGDGVAIDPMSSTVVTPCDGVIIQLAKTGHAFTLKTTGGAEILVHAGIDTVQLKGVGFKTLVKQGDSVDLGQAIIEVDWDAVSQKAPSMLTMVVLTNGDEFDMVKADHSEAFVGETLLFTLTPKQAIDGISTTQGDVLQQRTSVLHSGGLHARPAALIQNVARQFNSTISIQFNHEQANAKSIVSLMGLGVQENDEVDVSAQGDDAVQALEAVVHALQTPVVAHHSVAEVETPTTIGAAALAEVEGGFSGIVASSGLTFGPALCVRETVPHFEELASSSDDEEKKKLFAALEQVKGKLQNNIHQNTGALRDILTAHLALLEDPALLSSSVQLMREGKSAAYAFYHSIETQIERLKSLNNELLFERITDLQDVRLQVLKALLGVEDAKVEVNQASIIIAHDLTPSQLTALPKEKIKGIVLAAGGKTSHVAILTRSLGIPMLVACGTKVNQVRDGQILIVDAKEGVCKTQPTAQELKQLQDIIAHDEQRRQAMMVHAHSHARTVDGREIEVAVNIAGVSDAQEGVRMGADGVGLTRTEFLFSERQSAPSIQEQVTSYQAIIDTLAHKPVIIRTLDVGGDKEVPYLQLPQEENPVLGLRGVRSALVRPELLDVQLSALLQVKPLSQLRILLPMITQVAEIKHIRARVDELATQLGISERPQLGIMIEVPAAAIMAESLAKYADFFSIGSNDLTQYTMAMDRCNPHLAAQLDALNPALLRLIDMTVKGAQAHQKWVGVCGAVASELEAVPILVGLGVNELSVSVPLVPEVKDLVRTLSFADCQRLAQDALRLESAEAVRGLMKQSFGKTS